MTNRAEHIRELKQIRRLIGSRTIDASQVCAWYNVVLNDMDLDAFKQERDRTVLEYSGQTLDYVAQNIERDRALAAAESRSRHDWIKLERQYYDSHTPISAEDVFDELMPEINHQWEFYHSLAPGEFKDAVRRRIWRMCSELESMMSRKCAYVFCGGVVISADKTGKIVPAHGHQRYCCEAHKIAQANAERRFHQTAKQYSAGTYLPQQAYIPKRPASIEKAYQDNEVPASEKMKNFFFAIYDDRLFAE